MKREVKKLVDLPRGKQLEYTSQLIYILKNSKNNESKWGQVQTLRSFYNLEPHSKDSLRRSIILRELIEADCLLDPAVYTTGVDINYIKYDLDGQTFTIQDAPVGSFKKEFKYDQKTGKQIQSSEAILRMSVEESTSPEELLKLHGYNPDDFVLVKYKVSVWQQSHKEGIKDLYASRIEVAPKEHNNHLTMEDYEKIFSDILEKHKKDNEDLHDVKFGPSNIDELHVSHSVDGYLTPRKDTLLIMLSDCHLGRISVADETGTTQNLEKSIELLKDNVWAYVQKYKGRRFKRVILPIGNDLMNSDFRGQTTKHGHVQDNSTTTREIFKKTSECMIEVIEMLKEFGFVQTVFVPGNHGFNEEYALYLLLQAYFHDDVGISVSFDSSTNTRKYLKVGNNLICLSHGYSDFKKLGANMILSEASNLITPNCNIYFILGHQHHLNVTKEDGKVELWQCPAFCENDLWTNQMGYNAKARSMGFVFNEDEMIETYFVSI